MLCPTCGRYNHGKSTVCEYCGRLFVEEKRKIRKRPIAALIVVVVLGLSLFQIFQYETQQADKLVKAAAIETERGARILHEIDTDLFALREIQVEVETDQIVSEKQYALQSAEKVNQVLPQSDEAQTFFQRAAQFLEKCELLRLPSGYRQYVELNLDLVYSYQDYTARLRELGHAYVVYYEFSAHYITGEQHFTDLLSDMDRGNDHLEKGDYQFAFTAYQSALSHLEDVQKEYTAASKSIDLPYITDYLSSLDHVEKALDSLSEAARQLELGRVDEAAFLAALGITEMESMIKMSKLQLKSEVSQWYSLHIESIITDLKKIESEIVETREEAEMLKT